MKLTKTFIEDIRELIYSARTTVARGVDLVQVHTNFEIGRRIMQEEQKGKRRADYGKEVIKELAERLTVEFGRGFSKSNIEYMRRFYLFYEDRGFNIAQFETGQLPALKITQTASGQLPQSIALPSPPEKRPFSLSFEPRAMCRVPVVRPAHHERDLYSVRPELRACRAVEGQSPTSPVRPEPVEGSNGRAVEGSKGDYRRND